MGVHQSARPPVRPGLRGLVAGVSGYRIQGAPAGVHVGMPSRTLTLILALDEGLTLTWPELGAGSTTRLRAFVGGLHHTPPVRQSRRGRRAVDRR